MRAQSRSLMELVSVRALVDFLFKSFELPVALRRPPPLRLPFTPLPLFIFFFIIFKLFSLTPSTHFSIHCKFRRLVFAFRSISTSSKSYSLGMFELVFYSVENSFGFPPDAAPLLAFNSPITKFRLIAFNLHGKTF